MAAKHWFRHQNWKEKNPGKEPRQLRNLKAWIGKVIPADIDPKGFDEVNQCDCCGVYCEDWHSFLYPCCDADWDLLKKLHLDIAEGYCDCCIRKFELEAEQIAPGWQERHWAAA